MSALDLSEQELAEIFSSDDTALQEALYVCAQNPYYAFRSRPDDPEESDEQTSFLNDWESTFAICLGGTGSGKTRTAAQKTAEYVLERKKPPRPSCPFWIIGETLDQVCQVAWIEKLSELIPSSEILDIVWYKHKRKWPEAVLLRHPDKFSEVGWVLEFKSYKEGFSGMKAISIGGFWCNEEIPFHLVAEIRGRCRDYNSPGWADFTPVECRDPEWPETYEKPPAGWKFYHLNSLKNDATPPGAERPINEFMKQYLAEIPDDLREMRQYGRFTSLQGAVFKEFRRHLHVIDWDQFYALTGKRWIPRDWHKWRAIDFGYANPFCCLWFSRDHDGTVFVYDEHYQAQALLGQHVAAIKGEGEGHRTKWDPTEPWYGKTYADHAAQERAEINNLGISTAPARKSNKNASIEYVRTMMKPMPNGRPRLYILSNCRNLVREIPGYRWQRGTDLRNPKEEPVGVDDHAIDTMMYGVYSEMADQQPRTAGGFKKRPDYGKRGVLIPGGR